MPKRFWNDERLETAKEILKKHSYVSDAVKELENIFDLKFSLSSLSHALPKYCGISPGDLLKDCKSKYNKVWWTGERITRAREIFSGNTTVYSALLEMQKEFNRIFSEDSLRSAFVRYGNTGKLNSYLKKDCSVVVKDSSNMYGDLVVTDIIGILNKYEFLNSALVEIKKKFGIGKNALNTLLKSNFGDNTLIKDFLKKENGVTEKVEKLVEFIKKSSSKKDPIKFVDICNKLDLSPAKAEILISDAVSSGYKLEIDSNNVHLNLDVPKQFYIPKLAIPTQEKNKITIGVISDTHLGSKMAMKKELQHFIKKCYNDYGIKTILHAGDLIAGNRVYRGQAAELESWRCQDQCEMFAETLPKFDDLKYYGILGNHDVDFIKSSGTDAGFIVEKLRDDFKILGHLKAKFIIDPFGIEVELAHIKSSAHARSYSLEKHIHTTVSTTDQPDVIFCGHRHINGYFKVQGIHAFLCPCFEDETLFMKYHDYYPSVGGLIVTFVLNENNDIIRCDNSFHLYNLVKETKEVISIK